MRYFPVGLLVVVAGAAHALDIEVAAPGGPGPRSTCPGEVQFEQLPNEVARIISQEDVCYPFLCEAADDFVGTGQPITTVAWWGAYWGGGPIPADAFHINIYTTNSGGCPENLIYSHTSFDYEEDLDGSSAAYCAQLEAPFPSSSGVVYELSIVASLCYPPQWGWATGDGNGQEGCWRSEFLGVPEWTPLSDTPFGFEPYEFAFVLYTDLAVPIVEKSWGTIKGFYVASER
jgi:hypothetical protein